MVRDGNKWITNNALKIALIIASLIAAGAMIRESIADMKPRLKQVEEDVIEVEKDIIGVKGSVEALRVQQQTFHNQSDKKLDEIKAAIEAIDRRNDSP